MKKKVFRERRKKDTLTINRDKYFTFKVDDVDIKPSKPKRKKKSDK